MSQSQHIPINNPCFIQHMNDGVLQYGPVLDLLCICGSTNEIAYCHTLNIYSMCKRYMLVPNSREHVHGTQICSLKSTSNILRDTIARWVPLTLHHTQMMAHRILPPAHWTALWQYGTSRCLPDFEPRPTTSYIVSPYSCAPHISQGFYTSLCTIPISTTLLRSRVATQVLTSAGHLPLL